MWTRLCVDVDRNGSPIGWSAERHDEAGNLVGVITGDGARFRTVLDAITYARVRSVDTWGVPMRLFE